MEGTGMVALVVVGILAILVIFIMIWASRYIKVGPNEVLVISGLRHRVQDPDGTVSTVGYRIVKGGGAFVIPIVEKADILSLELLTLDVKLPEVYSVTGVPVTVDGVAQIKVKGDDISIATAAEQFLSKRQDQIMEIALQTIEGHLRAIIGTMTIEEIYKNREVFAQRVQEVAGRDMANMGMTVVSFTLRDIRDSQGYLDALGKPRIAAVRRDATIAQAEADRDATIKTAQATQAAQEAKYAAEAEIACAKRDFEMKQAEYQASVNQKKAESDLSYDLQKFKTQQIVKEQEVQVQVIEKQKMIDVQEKEILRKERELQAQVQKPADAEKYKIQAMAEAQRFKLQAEATGEAEAKKSLGLGEAEAEKAVGMAKASVIQATGEAEAAAMAKKAQAWGAYNEAAIVQILIEKLPEITRAVSEPLAKTEKIVIVNLDNASGGVGASKVTKDVANIIAQVPPLVEALSGVDLTQLAAKLPGLLAKKGETPPKQDKPKGKEA